MKKTDKFTIINFAKIDSTAAYALQQIESLHHLDVIVAAEQTAGHGQFERKWLSPKGNLYLTIILKELQVDPEKMLEYSSSALIQTLHQYGVKDARRKLPNDILVGNKKIAGILIKNIFRGHNFRAMMVSAGVNLNMSEQLLSEIDQPATSLQGLLGKEIDIDRFLTELLAKFDLDTITPKG